MAHEMQKTPGGYGGLRSMNGLAWDARIRVLIAQERISRELQLRDRLVVRLLWVLVFTFFTALLVLTAHAETLAPDQVVRLAADDILGAIHRNRARLKNDPEAARQFVEARVGNYLDIDRISQLVLGAHWPRATPGQRRQFTLAFKRTLVRSYSRALIEVEVERIEWAPLVVDPAANDVIVHSVVVRSAAPTVRVSYKMHRSAAGWKAYDVVFDGISLITNYRGSIAAAVRKRGLDAVILRLEANSQA